MQDPDYPIHWIFDYVERFTSDERNIALLLFDGKNIRETAYLLDLKRETVEAAFVEIANKTGLTGRHLNLKAIESGRFFKKWGFIRKEKPAHVNPMDDPMF